VPELAKKEKGGMNATGSQKKEKGGHKGP